MSQGWGSAAQKREEEIALWANTESKMRAVIFVESYQESTAQRSALSAPRWC